MQPNFPQARQITALPKGMKVDPLLIRQIRSIAAKSRTLFGITEPRIDVIGLYEVTLTKMGVVYDWCDNRELKNDHGLTFPNRSVIKIREDVYLGALDNNGRDRFTMCHEVGHLILHHNVAFSRSTTPHQWYEDSEWQADTYAAEFLMPVGYVVSLCRGPSDIMDVFGVSWDAAHLRWSKLQVQGLIRTGGAVSSRPTNGLNR